MGRQVASVNVVVVVNVVEVVVVVVNDVVKRALRNLAFRWLRLSRLFRDRDWPEETWKVEIGKYSLI